ncbi:MAG: putative glycoside hydrolase [Lachnospiraceae bacterium]|nr:putative glycoside hydrolase [Lachnospiraceae bacterium]
MKQKILRIAAAFMVVLMTVGGCRRYEPIPESGQMMESGEGKEGSGLEQTGGEDGAAEAADEKTDDLAGAEAKLKGMAAGDGSQEGLLGKNSGSDGEEDEAIMIQTVPERTPVKVKGIYVSAYIAGTEAKMDEIIRRIDETELNAVVIDVKDDNGRITFEMNAPAVQEIGACVNYIPDMAELAAKLKEHHIYMIARIPAFRDPYLADAKPEWCCKLADGSVFRDRNQLAWVNPYKKEVWDYLIQIAKKAGEAGFDEIQFDYIRFCTEKGMNKVVFDEADTEGRSRQEIILEFTQYAYEQLSEEGLFVSADVFGAVIGGGADAAAVGQDYREMAGRLDYICPMIYPSHYGDGNFGIAHPDTQPYDTILGALTASKEDLMALEEEAEEERSQATGLQEQEAGRAAGQAAAIVRPWLQDFTASYLKHYIHYGPEQVRQQIQAVYDAGYEEWILWSAAVNYHYDGLLPAEKDLEEALEETEEGW